MNLIPSQLGAEPKKLAVLGALAVVLVVVYFINRTPDVPQQAASTAPARVPVPLESLGPRSATTRPAGSAPNAAALTPAPPQTGAPARRGEATIQDFKPTLKLADGADVSRIDPALKLSLLAQLQKLPLEGGERSLFEFGAPPKPKTPTPTVARVVPVTPPPSATPAAPAAPPKPAIPPIPLKFYGYVSESRAVAPGAAKRAFFLDGDDIVVAGENDVIRNRFKVIRIGVNSAVVEDTTNKNQQTLPLVEELPG